MTAILENTNNNPSDQIQVNLLDCNHCNCKTFHAKSLRNIKSNISYVIIINAIDRYKLKNNNYAIMACMVCMAMSIDQVA